MIATFLHRSRSSWGAVLMGLGLSVGALAAAEPERVEVPSLDQAQGEPIRQPSFWFRAPVAGPAPAIVLLHGCGGPYSDAYPSRLSVRMREYAALLNGQGWHVLVTDSLSPRGERELCTQRIGTRKVTQTQRRRDALGAMQWLASRAEVDAQRVGLLGWSHGASNVLASTNAAHPEVAASTARPAFAVAFYPGCDEELRRGYRPTAPLLMLLGDADDWTPPGPCKALAQQSAEPKPQVEAYAGAYHGFDGTAPVRLRTDVPNGAHPGQGVHLGGDPAARAASRMRLLEFIRQATGTR